MYLIDFVLFFVELFVSETRNFSKVVFLPELYDLNLIVYYAEAKAAVEMNLLMVSSLLFLLVTPRHP